MPAPERRVDELGFPIPVTYENLRAPDRPQRSWPKIKLTGKLPLVIMGVVIVGLLFGPQIKGWIGKKLAEHWAQCAADCYVDDDLEGALAHVDRAIDWYPHRNEGYFSLRFWRAQLRLEANDPEGCIADCDEFLDGVTDKFNGGRRNDFIVWMYINRSQALQRLGRHDEAIADTTRAINADPHDTSLYNQRAYTRAIGNRELTEALADIEKAIAGGRHSNAAYLDTRGYLRYLTDDLNGGLEDMQRAIAITEREKDLGPRQYRFSIARQIRKTNENLAVMLHHRGLIYEKQGKADQAKDDFRRALELGYNPAEGVY